MPVTLGYVFWHRPRPRTAPAGYEASLVRFQSSLREHPPMGFVEAFSFREEGLPWSKGRSPAYEDWYLVKGFQALGDLNEGAIDAQNKGPHDRAAASSLVIGGGLYRLLGGELRPTEARVETWVRKPQGKAYQTFFEEFAESLGSRASMVWQRQLVLSPAPEFCFQSERALSLPPGIRGRVLRVRPVSERGA